jgi:adenylate cyclase
VTPDRKSSGSDRQEIELSGGPDDEGRMAKAAGRMRKLDGQPGLIRAAKAIRDLLPGDSSYGDPLSVAGNEPSHLIGQRLTARTRERPSALREVGLSALQVWQAVSEAQGRGRGDEELAILFTDLVGFSDWALEAGDTMAVELLRRVGEAADPPIESHGGTIVKRLGDGLMAVFDDPKEGVEGALEACRALEGIEIGGHSPRLRAGMHVGRPRKLGGDYFGVDVNIAARVASAAGAGEVLVSEAACERLDEGEVELRRRRFKAKGAPKGLKVYAAEPRS